MQPRLGIDGRRGAWLLGALLAIGLASSCSLIIDADEYAFTEGCPVGTEGCHCDAIGKCSAGLECRLPGFCVDPGSGNSAGTGGQGAAGAGGN